MKDLPTTAGERELEELTSRVETLSLDMARMKATWGDSLLLARQMQATAETLVLQLTRLVETLEGAAVLLVAVMLGGDQLLHQVNRLSAILVDALT